VIDSNTELSKLGRTIVHLSTRVIDHVPGNNVRSHALKLPPRFGLLPKDIKSLWHVANNSSGKIDKMRELSADIHPVQICTRHFFQGRFALLSESSLSLDSDSFAGGRSVGLDSFVIRT
jgi:hypothetical protein